MLRIERVTKSFGTFRAVDDVSIEIAPGEIVGLVGENGAGKTTLMRMLAGELAPDAGTIHAGDRVELVHQHFMLVGEFTAAENLVLAAGSRLGLLTRRRVLDEARALVERSGLRFDGLDRRADDLSVGERARLELVKALSRKPQLLILDEPTSVLTPGEADELFGVVRSLAAAGTTVLFISHKLPEVLAVATRIVVMRRGAVVADTPPTGMTASALATAMIGELRPASAQRRVPTGDSALRIEGLAARQLQDVNLTVHRGEIVAIVGVAGNGQSELAAVLRGIQPVQVGTIFLGRDKVTSRELMISARVGHVPEDRTRDGVVAPMSIAENIALTSRRWNRSRAERTADRLIELFSVRARSARQPAGDLSGGNQQKVLLARELDRRPDVIVASEPTRGLDVEASNFVRSQLAAAAAGGAGVLVITSDLDEAFEIADAIHVMYRGRLSTRMAPDDARSRVAGLMAGVA